MKLFEYQVKRLFADSDIPIPPSILIEDEGKLHETVVKIGFPCVLKAQVLTGGRGKAGLVRLVKDLTEAETVASALFSSPVNIHGVLVEKAIEFDREIYLAIVMDAVTGNALLMGCSDGGIDIEQIAVEMPERIVKEQINLNKGLMAFQLNDFVFRLGFQDKAFQNIKKIVGRMYKIFRNMDAELCEINPLFMIGDGNIVAGDGKLNIDDNSMSLHPEYEKSRVHYNSDMEYEAAKEGIPYIEFGGDISLMCAGAGLANTVYDLVHYMGGTVKNYLEFGGPHYKKAKTAMRLCLENHPKVILIVTFGTIARADVIAEGIVEAVRDLKPNCPIVACLRGTGEEHVDKIFEHVSMLHRRGDTEEAVRHAVAIAFEGREK